MAIGMSSGSASVVGESLHPARAHLRTAPLPSSPLVKYTLTPSEANPFGCPVFDTSGVAVHADASHFMTAPMVPPVDSAQTSVEPTRMSSIGLRLRVASGVGVVPQPVRAHSTTDPFPLPET